VHSEAITSADARFEEGNLSVDAFRANPALPFLPIQPGIEDLGGRRVENTGDL